MKQNSLYKIFVVFHDKINYEYYTDSILENLVFVNVNKNNLISDIPDKYKIINLWELNSFFPLGKWYTESEVIYNIFKNQYLYKDVDFIGFSQYDIDLTKVSRDFLENTLENYNHINFEPHLFDDDYNQNIMMDNKYPNKLVGKGINCYHEIIQDYNKFYNTNFAINDLKNCIINLCSSFILEKSLFNKMMIFTEQIIESKKLDFFDTEHKNRIQGGFLERYYGVWLLLSKTDNFKFKLPHNYITTHNIRISIFNRIINKIFG